ncbi:MAG: hypothetical protein V1822_02555, partial [Candidatus Micrarchaeota archaeon]
MPTVAHVVNKIVRSHPQLEQFIELDLVSFHRLARYLKPRIEGELAKEVDSGAIVMALSRMRDRMGSGRVENLRAIHLGGMRVSLRSDYLQIDIRRGLRTAQKLLEVQKIASAHQNEILSITQSVNEVTIITSASLEADLLLALRGEKILNTEKELSLLVLFFGEELLYQPGFFDRVLRELAWENINVYELISTLTEFIVVLKDEDAPKA